MVYGPSFGGLVLAPDFDMVPIQSEARGSFSYGEMQLTRLRLACSELLYNEPPSPLSRSYVHHHPTSINLTYPQWLTSMPTLPS